MAELHRSLTHQRKQDKQEVFEKSALNTCKLFDTDHDSGQIGPSIIATPESTPSLSEGA